MANFDVTFLAQQKAGYTGVRTGSGVAFLGSTPAIPAPTIALVSPGGGKVGTHDPVVLRVLGSDLRFFVVCLRSPSRLIGEVIYKSSTGFGMAYRGPVNRIDAITGGFQITCLRDLNWPAVDDLDFDLDAVNGGAEDA